MVAIADLLGKVKRPVRSVAVCLDGDLWAKHDDIAQAIRTARAEASARMGDTVVAELGAKLGEVEQAMRDAEVVFQFRGCSTYTLDAIQERFPAKEGPGWDSMAGGHALLAACSFDPVMTENEAKQLITELHQAAATKLFNTAWLASTGSADVPFSARAFASTSDSGSK